MRVGNIKPSDITKLDMLSRPGMGQASHSLISHTRTQSPDTSPSYHPRVPAGWSPGDHLTPSYPPHGRALQWQLSSDAEQLHLRHILPLRGAGLATFPSIRLCAGLLHSMLTRCSPPVLKQGFTFASTVTIPAGLSKSPYTSPAEHTSGSWTTSDGATCSQGPNSPSTGD